MRPDLCSQSGVLDSGLHVFWELVGRSFPGLLPRLSCLDLRAGPEQALGDSGDTQGCGLLAWMIFFRFSLYSDINNFFLVTLFSF